MYQGFRDAAMRTVRLEGVRGLYSGLAPALVRRGAELLPRIDVRRRCMWCSYGDSGAGMARCSKTRAERLACSLDG